MNDQNHSTQFDCMRMSAKIVHNPRHDDVVFLLSLFDHLEQQCGDETNQLEALTDSIRRRTEFAELSPIKRDVREENWPTLERSLGILERAKIAARYKIPHHIFGTVRASRGAKDLELLQLEITELRIHNYMAQMAELEAEIAAATPRTPKGVILKLRFMSCLCKEGSTFATDVFSFVVDQSVEELSKMLDIPVSDATP